MNYSGPVAALFGLTHVSVANVSESWVPMSWTKGQGPRPIGAMSDRDRALDRARAYVATYPHVSVLDVPSGYENWDRGMIHVDVEEDGRLAIVHEGLSGNSFAVLGYFDAGDRKRAITYALHQLPIYDARLGRLLSDDLFLGREVVP